MPYNLEIVRHKFRSFSLLCPGAEVIGVCVLCAGDELCLQRKKLAIVLLYTFAQTGLGSVTGFMNIKIKVDITFMRMIKIVGT